MADTPGQDALDALVEEIAVRVGNDATIYFEEIVSIAFADNPTFISTLEAQTKINRDGLNVSLEFDERSDVWPSAKQIEEGVKPFDIKQGVLQNSGGSPVTIGFEYGTSEQKDNPKLRDRSVRRFIGSKRQEEIINKAATQVSRDLTRRFVPRNEFKDPKYGPSDKAGIFQSINIVKRKSTGSAPYVTFRTISRSSDPSSWLHPGFDPQNFEKQVKEYAKTRIEHYFSKLSGGA